MESILDRIPGPRCELAESPLWDGQRGVLYWVDVPAGRVWRYEPGRERVEPVWQGEMAVGGITLARDGLAVYGSKGVWRGYWQADGTLGRMEPLFEIGLATDERFNDVIADPCGRVFAGTLTGRRENGVLYRLERGRPACRVLEGIGNSNGMGFSPDFRYFYHTDTQIRTIRRFDYDRVTGQIANPTVFYAGLEQDGKPDGLTVDSEGGVWAACFYGGKVIRLDIEGNLLQDIKLPAERVSSLAWGGTDYGDLYITTACNNDAGNPSDRGGFVYRCRPGLYGREEWMAGF